MTQNQTKVAFITGGNRGLGFETARELGQKGVKVVIGSRDKKNGEAAIQKLSKLGIEAQAIEFDVTKSADHQRAYEFFDKNFGRLDILVNNAGVFKDNGIESAAKPSNNTSFVTIAALKDTFESNFFAPILLTQKLLPLIKKAPAARIVNLSSILGSLGAHSDPSSFIYNSKAFAYDASKTALNAFTVHLAHELKDTKIKVNSAHPGWVKTDMGGPDAMLEVSEGAKTSLYLSLLPETGPTGGFFHLEDRLPW